MSNSRKRGQSVTRAQSLTTDQVLERFRDGPQTGIFTDGSCSGNPGPGGWGTVLVDDGAVIEERYGFDPETTNNRMEFQAMIVGLELLKPEDSADIYTDSKLVVDTLTKWAAGWEKRGWRRSDKLNSPGSARSSISRGFRHDTRKPEHSRGRVAERLPGALRRER